MIGLVLACAVIIHAVPGTGDVSLSERAVSKRWTRLLYGVSITVLGSLFWLYLYRDISQHEFVNLFRVAAIGGWLGMVLFAWIPSQIGPKSMRGPHSWAVLLMGLCITSIMAMVPFEEHNNIVTRFIAGVVTIWYCYTIYLGLFEQHGSKRRYLLLFELVNVGSFLVLMLAL